MPVPESVSPPIGKEACFYSGVRGQSLTNTVFLEHGRLPGSFPLTANDPLCSSSASRRRFDAGWVPAEWRDTVAGHRWSRTGTMRRGRSEPLKNARAGVGIPAHRERGFPPLGTGVPILWKSAGHPSERRLPRTPPDSPGVHRRLRHAGGHAGAQNQPNKQPNAQANKQAST